MAEQSKNTEESPSAEELLRRLIEEGQQRITDAREASHNELRKAMTTNLSGTGIDARVGKEGFDPDLASLYDSAEIFPQTQQMILTLQSVRLLSRVEKALLAMAAVMAEKEEDKVEEVV